MDMCRWTEDVDDTVVVYLRRVAQIAISLEVNAEGVVEVRLPPRSGGAAVFVYATLQEAACRSRVVL